LGGAALGQQGGPGSIFSAFSSNPPAPPNDPFAARGVTPAQTADSNGVTRLPPTTGPQQPPPAAGERYADAGPAASQRPAPGGNRPRSDALLRNARLALAVTDVRRASELVAQARQEQIRYAPNEDSPERVEAAIARFVEVSRLERSTEENRKTYARMLMEQSEALLQWGELEQADKLAALAVDQQVAYGPFDAKPEDLLKRIAALRQQGNPAGPRPIDNRYAAANSVGPSLAGRQQAVELMRQIRATLAVGQIGQAEFLCRQLDALRIPENVFAPGEDRPGLVFQDVRRAMARNASAVVPAGGFSQPNPGVQSAVYDPSRDPTRNVQVSDQQAETIPSPPSEPAGPAGGGNAARQSPGYSLFQQGEAALKARDRDRALQLFQQASAYSNDLDPLTAARLQDHLSLLSVPRNGPSSQPTSPLDEAAAAQLALLRQEFADVNHREADAKQMLDKDPKTALAMLQETRKKVEAAGLESAARDQLLRRLDRSIADTQHYIEQNRSRIELMEKNDAVRSGRTRDANVKLQTQQKLAELVDQYNRLNEDQRFEEALVIAKRAQELAPHEMVTQVMVSKSGILIKMDRERRVRDSKADHVADAFIAVDEASDPGTGEPYAFPDAKNWKAITGRRAKHAMELNRRRRSEKEIEIEKKLLTPVNYSCRNRPLSEVLNQLARLVNVNIHLDDEGLLNEGLSSDTPVTLELASDIQLKSYLNLILEKHHLCYIIKNEVLNITSETKKGDHVYQQVYPVGDLVIPIPNFVASPRMGLAGALHDAMGSALGGSGGFGSAATPLAVVASREGRQNSAEINPAVLANMAPRLSGSTGNQPSGFGPGGASGGTGADFDTLIDLITQTVSPSTWDHNGGKGNIAASPTNLSLVVSQTQEVHEQIVDLLEQLRRMQDLQVTIEVRFITLSDSFFERIGVDFDFTVAKNIANPQAAGFTAPQQLIVNGSNVTAPAYTGINNGVAVSGLQAIGSNPAQSGIFPQNNSISFSQGSYALAVPQFGAFDASAGATMGFAILSDIEAYFFINAAQGDKRTNILQAPKVTLFNGQQAFVSNTSQTPFVMSVVPVVGDFAAAQQPVIVVLSEGTFMTVQAVVSNDRRFVRMTIVPFFSKIGDVQTFTFSGTDTTTTDTSQNGIVNQAANVFNNNHNAQTTSHSGVTVQLPTFSYVTVTTTVSVPDGGTVLLGGIKALSEGRNEFGVPILDKVPYLNRLFKNVGIGRDTSSLMMMVTPRIIIQEEEEDKMGVGTGP
jgi:general secretion pathway protein D